MSSLGAVVRAAFAACALATTLAACAREPAPVKVLRIADGAGDLATLDPHLALAATLDHVAQMTMGYLVRYDPQGRPYPDLATAIPSRANGGISADGLTITWHLRRGVRWSDGAPFDARDVAFTTKAILNPANDEVEGTEGWNAIARIEMPDRFTVAYHLKRRYGALVAMTFATVGGGPCLLPEHLLGALHDINAAPYNAKPVGLGPYRVVAWRRGDRIELEANPYYPGPRPKIPRVDFEVLSSRETLLEQMRAGEIDLWPLAPPTFLPQLAAIAGVHVSDGPTLRTTHLDFLMTPDALADASVRRAVRFALDRREIVAKLEHGYGIVTDDIVWPLAPVDLRRPAIATDPARARVLLERDGWHLGVDGVRAKAGRRLSLRVAYPTGGDLDRIVEVMRAHLRAVGIEIVARPYQHAVLFGPASAGGILARAKFDATLYSSTLTSVPDLASNVDCAGAPPNGENFNRWCDPRATALVRDMRAASDPAVVRADFAALDRIFIDEVPSIQLFVWKGGFAYRKRLIGFRPNLVTSFDDIAAAELRE